MFPIKVGSNQAGFSFLDLILLIGDSVDRSTLNYCNKNPPDTPNIPIYEPRFERPPNVQVNHERKTVLAAEISFLVWDRNKATTICSAHFFERRWKRYWARASEIGYKAVTKRLASTAFLLPASTTDSNDKNLRTILELLKPPDRSFASKLLILVLWMFTRQFNVNYRSYDIRVPHNVLEGEVLSYIKWQDLGYLYKRRLAVEVFKIKQGLNHRQNHF